MLLLQQRYSTPRQRNSHPPMRCFCCLQQRRNVAFQKDCIILVWNIFDTDKRIQHKLTDATPVRNAAFNLAVHIIILGITVPDEVIKDDYRVKCAKNIKANFCCFGGASEQYATSANTCKSEKAMTNNTQLLHKHRGELCTAAAVPCQHSTRP